MWLAWYGRAVSAKCASPSSPEQLLAYGVVVVVDGHATITRTHVALRIALLVCLNS